MSIIEFTETDLGAGSCVRMLFGRQLVSVDVVIQATLDRCRLSRGALMKKDNHRVVSMARHVAMYLARHVATPTPSFPDIGRSFDRDHTTVMSAIDKIERAIAEESPDVLAVVREVQDEIGRIILAPKASSKQSA